MKKLLPQIKQSLSLLYKDQASDVRGISILEVLVSVAILGLVLLIVANVPQSIKLIGSSQHGSLAKDILVQEVERLRAASYDGLALGTTSISDGRLSSLPGVSSQETISNCPVSVCTGGELAKMADLKISWIEADNKVRNVQIVTLIAKGGLP
jgi:hypothetical protein